MPKSGGTSKQRPSYTKRRRPKLCRQFIRKQNESSSAKFKKRDTNLSHKKIGILQNNTAQNERLLNDDALSNNAQSGIALSNNIQSDTLSDNIQSGISQNNTAQSDNLQSNNSQGGIIVSSNPAALDNAMSQTKKSRKFITRTKRPEKRISSVKSLISRYFTQNQN